MDEARSGGVVGGKRLPRGLRAQELKAGRVQPENGFLRRGLKRPDVGLDLLSRNPHDHAQLVVRLQDDPDLGRDAEVAAQSQRRVRRDGPLAVDDLADAPRRHVDVPGQLVDANTQRLHELFEEDFSRGNRFQQFLGHNDLLFVLPVRSSSGISGNPRSPRRRHRLRASGSRSAIGR